MMHLLLSLAFLAPMAMAAPVDYTPPPGDNSQAITPTSVSALTIAAATATLTQNSAIVNAFPNSPLLIAGSVNTFLQAVLQNYSNGTAASGDFAVTNDLGSNTSFYLALGINSSKYSQAAYTSQPSSAAYVESADSDLFIWSDVNGGLNGAANGRVVFGSSNPVTANIAGYIGSPTTNLPGPWVVSSSFSVTHSSGANFVSGLNTPKITSGGAILISTAATLATASNANININTSGQVTFSVPISSFMTTGALSGTYTNTTIGPCITGSTITLTLPTGTSGIVAVYFHGTASVGTLNAVMSAGLTVDSALVDGETIAKGLVAPLEPVASDGTNLSFTELLTGLSAGTHNICLTLAVSAGTGTIDSTNSVMKMQAHVLP